MTSYRGLSWWFVDNKTTHCFHHETASATCKWGGFLSNHAFSVSLPGTLSRWQADLLAAGPSRQTVKESEKAKAWHRIYSCGQEYRLGDWPVDEFWKQSPAGKWWSPEGVGMEGSLTMSWEYTTDAGLLSWVELSTEHPERWCLAQLSLPAMAVFLCSHTLGISSRPAWNTHSHPTLYWKLPWEDDCISYTSNVNRMWNLRRFRMITELHILILQGSREPGWWWLVTRGLGPWHTEHSPQ